MGNYYSSSGEAGDALYAAAQDAGVDVGSIDWRAAARELVTSDDRRSKPGWTFDPVDPAALAVRLERFRR